MTALFDRVLLPVAHRKDAAATCRAVESHDLGDVVAVHVIEKAGGAPDKASVEQRENEAERAFHEIEACLPEAETEIRYGTSVTDTIFEAAADHDATSIVITPRGGNRFVQLLTGDVALHLVTESDRPVVVLPDPDDDGDGATAETGDEPGE